MMTSKTIHKTDNNDDRRDNEDAVITMTTKTVIMELTVMTRTGTIRMIMKMMTSKIIIMKTTTMTTGTIRMIMIISITQLVD